MSAEDRTARRYNWLSDTTANFVVEPHSAIVGDVKRDKALNMTAKASEGARKASVDIAKEPASKVMRLFESARKRDRYTRNRCRIGCRRRRLTLGAGLLMRLKCRGTLAGRP
jgi:hypothetical protein